MLSKTLLLKRRTWVFRTRRQCLAVGARDLVERLGRRALPDSRVVSVQTVAHEGAAVVPQ